MVENLLNNAKRPSVRATKNIPTGNLLVILLITDLEKSPVFAFFDFGFDKIIFSFKNIFD